MGRFRRALEDLNPFGRAERTATRALDDLNPSQFDDWTRLSGRPTLRGDRYRGELTDGTRFNVDSDGNGFIVRADGTNGARIHMDSDGFLKEVDGVRYISPNARATLPATGAAAPAAAAPAAASTGFMAQARSWLAKGTAALAGGALLTTVASNFVGEDSFVTRRTIDTTIGGLLDRYAGGQYERVGYTGELIIGRMTNDPSYAIPLINRALGTNIQLGENGIIPPGQLEEALRVLATQGVRGQSFLEAPQIIEAYLKNQLNIPQATPLTDALAQGAQRNTSDANAAALERYAATLRGEAPPAPAAAGAPPAAPAETNSISVASLVDPNNYSGIAGYMKNPSINLTVQFDQVSTILRTAAGSDNQLSRDEAQTAIGRLNTVQNLQPNQRAAIAEVINGAFVYGLQ